VRYDNAEGINQPTPPGLGWRRQLPFEQGRLLPSCQNFSIGLEQFGQELLCAFTLSFEVSPMTAGNGLHFNQLFRTGLEQFGQVLVRALTLSFKVSPMTAGDGMYFDQLGLVEDARLDGARAIELSESSWRSLEDRYGFFHPSEHALFSATHTF
jgi:hypothetical protein